MDDTLTCPICGNKLRNLRKSNRMERTCNRGMNHTLQISVNEQTKAVEFMKLSLNPKYSRFLEIDFILQKCRINCMKEGKSEYIDIPKMIEPDFPDLIKLKERVSLYVVFS